LNRSFAAAFVAGTGRDSNQYYENGRSIEIYVEMMSAPIMARIHRQNLKWNDGSEILPATKQAEVLSKLCENLDQHKIKWEFFDPK